MKENKIFENVKLSVLNLVPALEGVDNQEALHRALRLAQNLEKWDYHRLWISEHHNTKGLLSSATIVLITYLAQGTQKIRIGSGGIMLPNHAPLVVAEQVGTLATLFPDRIDLGLGRAPGTDQMTARALRRDRIDSVHDFPSDVQEVRFFLSEEAAESPVQALPGQGTQVPIYLLGSSTFSAQLGAQLGLPYAFASHFAPTHIFEALKIYRDNFQPSPECEKPYTMAAVNVVIADTDEEAQRIATSADLFRVDLFRNDRRPLQPPVDSMKGIWTDMERAEAHRMGFYSFVGSPETVKRGLEGFVTQTGVDEVIASSFIYEEEAEAKSYRLLAELWNA